MAAAAVAYIGPFTAKYRKELVSLWMEMCKTAEIPISDKFDLVKNTVDAHQVSYSNYNKIPLISVVTLRFFNSGIICI